MISQGKSETEIKKLLEEWKLAEEERSKIRLVLNRVHLSKPPKEVKTGVNKKEAEEIKAKLEAAGAKVELK